jgi:cyclopropane-fatty-acyl-phospholipid synthase
MTEYQGASVEAIQGHYDLGNDFYALWLDRDLTYSCALWESADEPLASAQARKLDYLAVHAHAPGATRVLDVGSGWGSMLRRLVDQHGVAHATGLTLSEAQAEHVGAWADDRIEVGVENWAEHQPESPYDAIVSIGAFEHFASYGLLRDERAHAYRQFFERCHQWLREGGRLAVQTIVKGNNTRLDREMTRELLFVIDHIFTESELPWPSEILTASERLFDLVTVRNDPDHYALTCQRWLRALLARRAEAEALVGSQAVVDYERYLRASVRAFRRHHVGLMRLIFERR